MLIKQGKRAKLREDLEEIANAFRLDFPQVFWDQLELVKQARAGLKRKSGSSDTGTLQMTFALHPLVFKFVKHRLGHDFFRSKENMTLLGQIWKDLRVGR